MSGYIGTQPVPQATQTRDAFTATNNQTSFPTSGYTPEFLDVFLNGVKLAASDYTATNGSDVVLAVGATTSDILEVVAYSTFEVLNPTFDGNVTFTGNASFGDNDKAIFGDGSDLQIYHDGSHSRIVDAGTGNLSLQGNDLRIKNADATATYIQAANGGAVELAHNNQIKLATTATGIDVTGTVAATAYTGDGSNLTGTGSPSITDNGNATAITIDSSENVLVGKTTDAFGTAGIALRSTVADFTRDSGTPVNVNRLNDDGRLIALHKDSVVVGSIGVTNGTNAIFDSQGGTLKLGTVGTERYNFDLDQIYPTVDNDTNLGLSSKRFKDAYLSGGVYLGGTGSANKLDDYEEGTWTPVLVDTSSTPTFHNNLARYTKIGRVVTLTIFQQTNANPQFSVAGSSFKITGIPFAVLGSGYTGSQGFMNCQAFDFNGSNNNANISGQVSPAVINTHNELRFVVSGSGQTRGEVKNSGAASGYIIEATIIYYTDA